MDEQTATREIKNFGDFWKFFVKQLKPQGNIGTPFNIISLPIMLIGYVFIVLRLAFGLGQPITNLSQEFPWGLWIGFDVVTGVAFAGGAYVLCFIVYILRGLGASIKRVQVYKLENQTYFANLIVLPDGEEEATTSEMLKVDCRPSDAIALAVRVECPIFVSEAVLDAAGQDASMLQWAEPDEEEPDSELE